MAEPLIIRGLESSYSTFSNLGGRIEEWNKEFKCLINPTCWGITFPIVLDLDGNGLSLVDAMSSTARFDMDNDGYDEKTGWIMPGDALFVIDHNGSGSVDRKDEFALSTFANEEGGTDLDGLRSFDTNNDGIFDSQDQAFDKAGLWIDQNADAVFDDGEFVSANDFGFLSIKLTGSADTPTIGNALIFETIEFEYETESGVKVGTAGDVAFLGLVSYLFSGALLSSFCTLLSFDASNITQNRTTG